MGVEGAGKGDQESKKTLLIKYHSSKNSKDTREPVMKASEKKGGDTGFACIWFLLLNIFIRCQVNCWVGRCWTEKAMVCIVLALSIKLSETRNSIGIVQARLLWPTAMRSLERLFFSVLFLGLQPWVLLNHALAVLAVPRCRPEHHTCQVFALSLVIFPKCMWLFLWFKK